MKKQAITTFYASALMLTAVSGGAADLAGHWRFDEGVGQTVRDSSRHNQDAMLQGIKWVQGVHNGCAQFGPESGVTLPHNDSQNFDRAMTVQAWIRPRTLNYKQYPNIIKKNGAYSFGFQQNKHLAFSVWLNGTKVTCTSKTPELTGAKWQHVAATYDGASICIYVNGALDKKMAVSGGSISKSTADCWIGAAGGKYVFEGNLDELKVEGTARSSREIAQETMRGEYEIARRENRFTDFYEKNMKRSAQPVVPGTLWVDAEDFDDYGGWWMDTQFVPQMGSPYLIAAGVGESVANAKTTITVPAAGTYKLWVRNKNWLANGHTPGQFAVSINGQKSKTTFGTAEQRAWVWQDGGTFELESGATALELEDLTGYYGRCDALILTKDLSFVPRQEQRDYRAERNRFVDAIPTQDMGHYDVVVVGGGVAGCNAAIAAARGGVKVALIQDRPMVGGNNSAELGVPVSGGSSSGKGRETGLNEEIGRIHAFNYLSKWATGAERVLASEPNVSVFLNSHVFEAETDAHKKIQSVTAFDMIDNHLSRFTGDIFIDCSGDGWLGYYAGAECMVGRESKEMFGESNAKDIADSITMSGSLFQNSVLGFQALDMGQPTEYDAPDWVYDLRSCSSAYPARPSYQHKYKSGGWWTENHGRNDDLWDPEWARDDLIMVSLSWFNWVKKYSSLKEKAARYQIKYIPITNAKRETRRLVGDHILFEQEVVQRKVFEDRVGHFAWKLDVHHPLGIFSTEGPYDFETNFEPASIPFRILYSKDVPNMLMAGRQVSVTHATLGTARVQGTTGLMGQAVGTAAALCIQHKTTPRGIYQAHLSELQQQLIKDDVTILHMGNEDPNDLARTALVTASSYESSAAGPQNAINGQVRPLDADMRMWIGKVPNNMWISDPASAMPQWLALDLPVRQAVNAVYLTFDTNLGSKRYTTMAFEQKDRMPPECVRDYQVQVHTKAGWKTVAEVENNYQRRRIHRFPAETTTQVRVLITATNGDPSARIYEIRAYNE